MLPYRLFPPRLAVIPWDGKKLLGADDDQIDDYPGLAAWWRKAEEIWNDIPVQRPADTAGSDSTTGTS